MSENHHLVLVQAFIAQLYQSGVRDVCISPGSRSTPLTMAFVRHGGFSLWSVLDERSSGFFAVGLARSKQQPVVLVCTSGTATGNYLPAVMEAHNARLALLVVTADRPPELYDTGANQTVYQQNLYGPFVKWYHQMPVPEAKQDLMRHAVTVAARAAAIASSPVPGPVHVNWPFREPLIIPEEPFELPSAGEAGSSVRVWSGTSKLQSDTVAALRSLLTQHQRGMILCGPGLDMQAVASVVRFAEAYGWPVLADPLSQLRAGEHNKTNIIETYDILMRTAWFQKQAKPEVIVRFGAAMTSKVLGQFLATHSDVRQVVVDEGQVWVDPSFTATDVVRVSPQVFCEQLGDVEDTTLGEQRWLLWWQRANGAARVALDKAAARSDWYEGQIVPELLSTLPEDTNIFVGNSMPIRDFDSLMSVTLKRLRLFANRGVSGIDGVVSSALGVAAASKHLTVLVIGDVSFYHDLNALLVAKRNHLNLLVFVVNNDGGGIFTFLPQAEYTDTFAHFRTAHGMEFSGAESLYGAKYTQVRDWQQFRQAVNQLVLQDGLRIIELTFDPAENRTHHQYLFEAIAESAKLEKLEGMQWK